MSTARARRDALGAFLMLACIAPLGVPGAAVAASAAGAAVAATTPSLCAPAPDTLGPALTKVSFARASIDLSTGSRIQTVYARASDLSAHGTPSGVSRLRIAIYGNFDAELITLHLVAGTTRAGLWAARFAIPLSAHAGTYSIGFVQSTDAVGNEQDYSGDQASEDPDEPRGPNSLSEHPATDPTFAVTGIAKPQHAATPHSHVTTLAFSPSAVNTTATARRVRIAVHVTGTAPTHVFVRLLTDPGAVPRPPRGVTLTTSLARDHTRWSGSVVVPRWLGEQHLRPVIEADYASRYRIVEQSWTPAQLARSGLTAVVRVVSGVDRTKPRLTALTVSPNPVATKSAVTTMTFTAKVADAGSGVRYVNVVAAVHDGSGGSVAGTYPFPGVGYRTDEQLVVALTKRTNGSWVGTAVVPRCAPSGTYTLSVGLYDFAANYLHYSPADLVHAGLPGSVGVSAQSGDDVRPYVWRAVPTTTPGEVALTFSEGVRNLSPATLAIYPNTDGPPPVPSPVPIAAITCSNGIGTVDCSGTGGLVTSAVVSAPGLQSGQRYDFDANLDHVTPQLADGDGNPMDWNTQVATIVEG